MSKDLEKKIQATETRLEGLKEKRAEYDAKIKKTEDELESLNTLARSEQFSELETLASANGMSMDDIMSMIRGGNAAPAGADKDDERQDSDDDVSFGF